MAEVELSFPPGMVANGTRLQTRGRWYDGNLVRFFEKTVRPWGGWDEHITVGNVLAGKARSVITWTDNSAGKWIAVGTSRRLYAIDRLGAVSDITPIRSSGTLGTDPFAVTDTLTSVTVTHNAHGALTGDRVYYSGATAGGGITISGWYTLTRVDANTYTITHSAAATSTDSTTGGASVAFKYQISPGVDSATIGGGYGSGAYGANDYGESSGSADLVTSATVWSLDTFGENLVALNNHDGKLYKWELDIATPAAVVSGAPTGNAAMVVEETGHILLLGSGSDGRVVAGCDAQDETAWTPGLPSEAMTFPLETGGRLKCGKRTAGGTILLTDQDAWIARYNGGANPFSFEQIGLDCGAISQGCAVTAGTSLVAWMGPTGFWSFNGAVAPIPCDVSDRVFGDIEPTLASHVTGYHRSAYGEIVWHYATAGALENDRYVAWSYREGHWSTGALERLCGCDRGAFAYPLAIDGDGMVWRHETGYDYNSEGTPYIESGPVQFQGESAPGDRVFTALSLIPDENTLGDVEATFYGRFYPTGDETTYGPYTAANPTDVRFTTRHVRMRLTGDVATDWRVGSFKLDIQLGGLR